GRCQFTTWLFQVAKHRVVDELRARERRGRPTVELSSAPQRHLAVAPVEPIGSMDAVWEAIGRLSLDLKMALLLRDVVGLSYAEALGRGIGARLAGMVADGGRVLDAGCGPGHIAAHLNGLGLAVTGIDLSTRMLEVARRRVPGVEFVHGNMLALPQPDGSFAG